MFPQTRQQCFEAIAKTFNVVGGAKFEIFKIKLHLHQLLTADTPVVRAA